MSPTQLVIAFAAIALEATLLAAILIRKRYATCFSFALYLAAVLVPGLLFAVWPEHFYTLENYFLRETLHNLLKFAIALELGYRTFRVFPTAILLIFSVGMRAVVQIGLRESYLFHRAHTIAYVALLLYWNRAAWASTSASVRAPPSRRPTIEDDGPYRPA